MDHSRREHNERPLNWPFVIILSQAFADVIETTKTLREVVSQSVERLIHWVLVAVSARPINDQGLATATFKVSVRVHLPPLGLS